MKKLILLLFAATLFAATNSTDRIFKDQYLVAKRLQEIGSRNIVCAVFSQSGDAESKATAAQIKAVVHAAGWKFLVADDSKHKMDHKEFEKRVPEWSQRGIVSGAKLEENDPVNFKRFISNQFTNKSGVLVLLTSREPNLGRTGEAATNLVMRLNDSGILSQIEFNDSSLITSNMIVVAVGPNPDAVTKSKLDQKIKQHKWNMVPFNANK